VARIPGKESWTSIVPYYERLLDKQNVRIFCGQAPTVEDIRKIAPKAVIIATGAAPDPGEIEMAENTCAVDAFAALAEPEAVGDEVAIVGAQRLAVDTALYLSSQGKRVTILCRGLEEDYLLSSLTPSMRSYALEKLSHENINMNYGASCCSIDQACLSVLQDGHTCEMVFETVVLAASMKPVLPDCVKDISRLDAPVFRVGDCLFPRGIGSAVLEGFEAGSLI
jgi:pyruvate/2-oxoglutarate dehydrogenase complex dihydrolipoamide dehydrogenase (E3) component